jgi:hypothetical protein
MKIIVFLIFAFALKGIAQADPVESDFDRFFCAERDASGECTLYRVSIINLITTPEKFHGKKVRIRGYLSMEFEESALYFSKDSTYTEAVGVQVADWTLTEESIDNYRKKEEQIRAEFNNHKVLIEGEFDMYARAFLLRGVLRKITRIQR